MALKRCVGGRASREIRRFERRVRLALRERRSKHPRNIAAKLLSQIVQLSVKKRLQH